MKTDKSPSIVDVLLGRHQHEPVMKITGAQRQYHSYHQHTPSRDAELKTGGRQRNRVEFEDPASPIAQTIRDRGY